jgi:hypothetical protein
MSDSILQYQKFPRLNKKWTPIEEKMVKIQIGNNSSHIITRIQFSIQLHLNSPFCNKKIKILDNIVKEEIH